MIPSHSTRTTPILIITSQDFWDPNFTSHPLMQAEALRDDAEPEIPSQPEDSPYPEVRHSVHPHNDPTVRTSTFRSWILGVIFSILLPGVNQFFFYRYPNVQVQGIIAQLLVHPLGLGTAMIAGRLGQIRGLNWIDQGRWTVKEHTMVSLIKWI